LVEQRKYGVFEDVGAHDRPFVGVLNPVGVVATDEFGEGVVGVGLSA
jgi:hypothetical protein